MTYPSFNSGDILTASDMNGVGLWLVKSQTIGTGVSSVTVTGAFSADYDDYRITITGGGSSVPTDLRLQVGASVTGYYAGYSRVAYATGIVTGRGDNNAARFQACGTATTNGLQANFDLSMPFLSSFTYFASPVLFPDPSDNSGFGTGFLNDTTSHTAFTISPLSGTMTGGTIRVYGYRK